MTSTETLGRPVRHRPTGRTEREPGRTGLTILGLVMLVGGMLAFFNPFAASLTVTAVAGAAFLLAGLTQLWLAFSDRGDALGGRMLGGLIGLALVLFAVSLLLNPVAGLITLTLAVAVLFAILGLLRLVYAFRMRARHGWGWIAGAGLMSLALAGMIVLGLPGAAADVLGLFLGVDLTLSGIATLALAWNKPRAPGQEVS
ncbi:MULTISPECIES: HdeD family acid-resistance protein [unclassified Roseovarius]|uniref:HdeD family acid-resistance protein n=1 Tax=unclassified Roseovarius TaxID=2614913 RepID=UPI00273FD184|nr:HdeD family acid-resistance protein [Roseovarius sp. MMSF_3350]